MSNAIGYAIHYSRPHDAVIRVDDASGNDRMRIDPERDATGGVPELDAASELE